VSWHLGPADLGSAARQDDFRADTDLPSGWYQVKPSDYTGYGFDRGHNCPSADRTATLDDNSATFLMSNMMPQAPQNNQQTWGNLEDYYRKLVGQGNNGPGQRTLHRVRQLRAGWHGQCWLLYYHREWQSHHIIQLLESGCGAASRQQRRESRHEQHPHYCCQHAQ